MTLAAKANRRMRLPKRKEETLVDWNAETQEIMQALLYADRSAGNQTREFAKSFKGSDQEKMEALWQFVREISSTKKMGGSN